MLIAKSGLDLDNKKKALDYADSLTKGFQALGGYVGKSNAIGYALSLIHI